MDSEVALTGGDRDDNGTGERRGGDEGGDA
jgi:hypothetical protein